MKKQTDSTSNRKIETSVNKRSPSDESTFNVGAPNQFSSPRLESFNKEIKGETINDTFCFFIVCPTHKKVAVAVGSDKKALWLPFIYVSPTTSWKEAITEGVATILSGQDKNTLGKLMTMSKQKQAFDSKILEIFRYQMPKTMRVITRNTCLIVLKNMNKVSSDACPKHKDLDRIQWLDIDKVTRTDCWGPEVSQCLQKFNKYQKEPANYDSYQDVKEFFIDDVYQYYGRTPPKNLEEWLLMNLKINEQVVDRLFLDYFEHCFPSFYMSKTSFVEYLCKYGFERTDRKLTNLFHAFRFHRNNYLSFHEVLLGIAAIDPKAPNIESRFKFVFRYFDSDCNGCLNEKEFRALIKDINKTDPEDSIEQKVKENMKKMKASDKGVEYEEFRKAITSKEPNLQFRGTSNLCRASAQLFNVIGKVMLERSENKNKQKELKNTITELVSQRKYSGICENCKKQENDIALHSISLDKDGQLAGAQEINEIKNISGKRSKDKYSDKYWSDVTLNAKSLANVLKNKIKEFNKVKGTRDNPKGFMADSGAQREEFYKMLSSFCKELCPILESEERCLKISSPIVIIGDIHGNIEDLFSIENCLLRSFPLVANDYLFLGDYVDRGKWSIECAIYILCLKALAPHNVFLLRGNHETRLLQQNYGFLEECRRKYDSFGQDVWEMVNRIFDRLPLAAIVDDSIFCCHGGIPSFGKISDIDKILVDLREPETASNLGWELVWNDPVNDETMREAAQLQGIDNRNPLLNRGFVNNKRRGTGYFFNAKAAEEFLMANGLTHVVRAHEVPKYGFALWFDFKVVTVFSHSHYSGVDNKAAVIQVYDQRLRVIIIDTVNNSPATDDTPQKHKR